MTNPLPFDTFTLAASVAELRGSAVGARVQKVYQPSSNDVILAVFGRSGPQRLLLSADPRQFRLHTTQVKRENPQTPPAFCQLCRKYLEGAAILEIEMPHFDRIARFVFRAPDGERVTLIAELMGRNANLILVSGAGIVRGTIRPMPADTERPLRSGLVYVGPPGLSERLDPLDIGIHDPVWAEMPDGDGAAEWLARTFSGIGRFATAEIVARADAAGGLAQAFVALITAVREEQFEPHSIAGTDGQTLGVWAFEPLTVPAGRRFPRETMAIALDTFYATLAERTGEQSERSQLTKALAREIAFREKELTSARATIAEAERAEEYERHGNNLLAQLTLVPRGAASVLLVDLYSEDGNAVTVTLDPKKSPQENAESYFVRARKVREAADYADGKAADLEAELDELRELAVEIERADESDYLARLRTELAAIVGAGRVGAKSTERPKPPGEKPFGGFKVRQFTVDGFQLLVGESAEANDYLVTRVASPSDLWFHVRGAAGAHGILRTQGQPSRVPDTIVRRAAEIVAARSGKGEKHASIVPVDVTEKRYVRKPRGAKPGLVSYERERTLDISPRL